MDREKPADLRCQHVFENGKQCDRKIDGRGAWQYCSRCRKAAQKKAKRQRDKEYRAKRRKADREEDNLYHYLYNHDLTNGKLKPYVDRAESLREHQSHFYTPNFYFTISVSQVVTARWESPLVSPLVLTKIEGIAQLVRKHWIQQGDLLGVALTLFVESELYRLKFVVNPTQRQFLKKARIRFDSAKRICDLAGSYYTGDYKEIAICLGYLVPSYEETLVRTGEKPWRFAASVKVLKQKINGLVDNNRCILQLFRDVEEFSFIFDLFLGGYPYLSVPNGDFCAITGWQFHEFGSRREVILLA
jgi:hypothetical protein